MISKWQNQNHLAQVGCKFSHHHHLSGQINRRASSGQSGVCGERGQGWAGLFWSLKSRVWIAPA